MITVIAIMNDGSQFTGSGYATESKAVESIADRIRWATRDTIAMFMMIESFNSGTRVTEFSADGSRGRVSVIPNKGASL